MDSYERNITVDKKRVATLKKEAEKYSGTVSRIVTKHDYSRPESSLGVASDHAYQKKIEKAIKSLKGSRHVVLIGIGGSNLGTEAVYHAVALRTSPTLHVLDAIEPDALTRLSEIIVEIENVDELAVCIISKSGTTSETITNAVSFIEVCEKHFNEAVRNRIVLIGTEKSDFIKNGKKENVRTLGIPEAIGGRYSVFTAVGIAPLEILNIDTTSLLEGAADALDKKHRSQIALQTVHLAALAEDGVHTVNFFTFNERLRVLGFWYRQLLAESIGKAMTTEGATFSHQLLPTVASSVDLHSMAQLYLGGYKGMFTHFIYGDVEHPHHKLSDHWLLEHLPLLKGHTPLEVKHAIREGVLKAYDDQKLPYRLTHLSKITTYELGLLMAREMFSVMCLGALLKVDVFNQPNVESYKLHTRKILSA